MQPTHEPNPVDARRWRFGPFVLWEGQRRLERHGQSVRVGSRGLALLLELVKRAGEVVAKSELLAAVWSGVVVDEASVRVHMSMLRKSLGKPRGEDGCLEWIENVPLRGYCFVGKVICESEQPAGDWQAPNALPARLSNLVARDFEVDRLQELLEANRLVTVTGCGGVGKTSVAICVADCLVKRRQWPIRFVDLGPLTSPGQVLTTLGRAIGVRCRPGGNLEQAIVQCLGQEAFLLLVDNCEHVLESFAPLAQRLLAALPDLRILSTSREPLGVAGEHVLRLLPLQVHEQSPSTLSQALQAPAVQLLVERAIAAGADAFDDSSAAPLMEICRQVDGIPLAIEIMAARLGMQGPDDLAFRLDDHMRLHSPLKRAAHPRQRTLAASHDWSVRLLSEAELLLFRRLSILPARFDVEAALSLVANELQADAALDALISLVGKSLVFHDARKSPHAPYKLPVTTRSYARALLAATDLAASNWCSIDNTVCGSACLLQANADA